MARYAHTHCRLLVEVGSMVLAGTLAVMGILRSVEVAGSHAARGCMVQVKGRSGRRSTGHLVLMKRVSKIQRVSSC